MISGGSSSPRLPLELEREIFETAAELYPETIYTPCLLLVAKRVHEWIERIKYRAVASEPTPAYPLRLLQNAICSNSKPTGFFHDRVRHLFIDDDSVPEDDLLLILSSCSGIRSLMLTTCPGPSVLPRLAAIHLRRLSISLFELFGSIHAIDLSHPAFTSVTHLELFEELSLFTAFPWSNFALLPALTHLSLYELHESNAIDILSQYPKLVVLISMNDAEYPTVVNKEELPSIDDARFVCMELSYGNYVDDWLAATKGDVDFWVRAERFIAKKRRGEIQPSTFYDLILVPFPTPRFRFEVLDKS
ncbi:hypothetical protein FB451DRAFT_1390123 [Mycena latifolia]|nr:hypothetical protein FB451DRAFT_1390123 [Mycena latifolia]